MLSAKLSLEGAFANNLKLIPLDLRYGNVTYVCGPAASGKSSLLRGVIHAEWLYRQECRTALDSWKTAYLPQHPPHCGLSGLGHAEIVDLLQLREQHSQSASQLLKLPEKILSGLSEKMTWRCDRCNHRTDLSKGLSSLNWSAICIEITRRFEGQVALISLDLALESEEQAHTLLASGFSTVMCAEGPAELGQAVESRSYPCQLELLVDHCMLQPEDQPRLLSILQQLYSYSPSALFLTLPDGTRHPFQPGFNCRSCGAALPLYALKSCALLAPFLDQYLDSLELGGISLTQLSSAPLKEWLALAKEIASTDQSIWKNIEVGLNAFKLSEIRADWGWQALPISVLYQLLCIHALSEAGEDHAVLIDAPSRFLNSAQLGALIQLSDNAAKRGALVVVADTLFAPGSRSDHFFCLGPGAGEDGGNLCPALNTDASLDLTRQSTFKRHSIEAQLEFRELKPLSLFEPPSDDTQPARDITQELSDLASAHTLKFRKFCRDYELKISTKRVVDQLDVLKAMAQFFSKLKASQIMGIKPNDFLKKHLPDRCAKITYRGLNWGAFMQLNIEQAGEYLAHLRNLEQKLKIAFELGLSHLVLARSVEELSMGERLKLELLSFISAGHDRAVLDYVLEPCAGLSFEDALRVTAVIRDYTDARSRVVIRDHHPALRQIIDPIR